MHAHATCPCAASAVLISPPPAKTRPRRTQTECLCEATLELLVDEAHELLAGAPGADEAPRNSPAPGSGAPRVRNVCRALTAAERELFLAFAALLRAARAASSDATTEEHAAPAAAPAAPAAAAAGGARHLVLQITGGGTGGAEAAGGGDGSAAVAEPGGVARALCGAFASWLVHPLGELCAAARDAAAVFLWLLVVDDSAHRWAYA